MGRSENLKLKASNRFSKRNSLKFKALNEKGCGKLDEKVKDVNRIADLLVRRFDAEQFRPFFRKCAWHLSENQIWSIYERCAGANSKLYYFIGACKSEMRLY